jgi:hypothetical protein
MEMVEATSPGTGTYTDREVLFNAQWTSNDENTTYTLTGMSIASRVILGWGEKVTGSDDDTIFFVGILSSIFPD